ncbi:hypothetical protein [Lactobacillus crispatus]|uniref:hypothetical protein n=1 Tax=Lactobacillus crispatus TaxID=47770 RepID=UPI00345109A5
MPKIKKVYKTKYTVIDNAVIEDTKLSWKAKGLFTYLWSRPDNWNFYVSEVAKHARGSRDQVMTGLEELETAGYLLRSRKRDKNGRLTSENEWLLSQEPNAAWIAETAEKKHKKASKPKVKKKKAFIKAVYNFKLPKSENPTLLNTNQTKYLLNKIISLSLSKPLPKIRTVDKSPAIDYEREEKLNHIIFKFNQARAKYHTPIVSFSKTERDQLANAIGSKSLDQLEKQLESIIDNVAIFAKQYPAGYFISSVRNLPEVNINA